MVTQKDGNIPLNNKHDEFGNKVDVTKILTNAMLEDEGVEEVLKKYVPAQDIPSEETHVEKNPVEKILSYKYKFDDKDEEDKMSEKLEELEVDRLFGEMRLCLQSSKIGSSGASMEPIEKGVEGTVKEDTPVRRLTWCFDYSDASMVTKIGVLCWKKKKQQTM